MSGPAGARHGRPWHQFAFWWGGNVNMFNVVLGAVTVSIGLTFWWALIAIAAGTLIGALLVAVLHFVPDEDAYRAVGFLKDALAPGSYLALTHVTSDKLPPRATASARAVYANATEQMYLRTKAQIERFFDGLELVPPYLGAEPSVVHMGLWGCEDPELADSEGSRWGYGGVARRP